MSESSRRQNQAPLNLTTVRSTQFLHSYYLSPIHNNSMHHIDVIIKKIMRLPCAHRLSFLKFITMMLNFHHISDIISCYIFSKPTIYCILKISWNPKINKQQRGPFKSILKNLKNLKSNSKNQKLIFFEVTNYLNNFFFLSYLIQNWFYKRETNIAKQLH